MTDLDETTRRLRAALDELVADVPAVPPHPPLSAHRPRHSSGRRHPWQRSLAVISIAVAAAVVIAAVVSFGSRSSAPPPSASRHGPPPVGVRGAPPGWITLPLLLPTGAAVLDHATVVTGPVPAPSAGTYEQVYQGAQTTNPPELLVTTVRAQPGALSDYATTSQTVIVNGQTAYMTNGSHHQLLWQTADGVVVSLESTGMTSSAVVQSAQLVEPHPAAQLGVDVTATLPDGLVFAGGGFASENTGENQDSVFFHQDTCHAYTEVWAGSPADFVPVAIVSDATRIVTIGGAPGLAVHFGSTSALLWSEEPGIDIRLQGGADCDLPAIAAHLKVVDGATWNARITALGPHAQFSRPKAPPSSSILPGPGTYGLAH